MNKALTEKIGRVSLTIHSSAKGGGAPSKSVHDFIQDGKTVKDKNDWSYIYEFSPRRATLIDLLEFNPGYRVLELNAGCGVFSGLLAEKSSSVISVCASEAAARDTAKRHSTLPNLEVVAARLAEYKKGESFDTVFAIDAGQLILQHNLESLAELLEFAYDNLNPGGNLVLAVDNSLALKSWAGIADPLTKRPFDAIEGHPFTHLETSFSKTELTNQLKKAGFGNCQFYMPLPDFVEPVEIYSEKFLPSLERGLSSFAVVSDSHNLPKVTIFNENLALGTILRAEAFESFANSFLIIATRGADS